MTFPDNDFRRAIELGRTELLAEIIRRTGAGLPLEELVKGTGVEIKEKPRFYQGLTVYGKKRQALYSKVLDELHLLIRLDIQARLGNSRSPSGH